MRLIIWVETEGWNDGIWIPTRNNVMITYKNRVPRIAVINHLICPLWEKYRQALKCHGHLYRLDIVWTKCVVTISTSLLSPDPVTKSAKHFHKHLFVPLLRPDNIWLMATMPTIYPYLAVPRQITRMFLQKLRHPASVHCDKSVLGTSTISCVAAF